MSERRVYRRAKILCTIGPASHDPDVFRKLVDAGLDGVRVNFSHIEADQASEIVSMARRAAKERNRPIAVVADLQGPKIRVGELDEPIRIAKGDEVLVVPEEEGDAASGEERRGTVVPTTYARLAEDVRPGDRVLFDDGRIALVVRQVTGRTVLLEAENEGTLHSQKGINLPGVDVAAPSLTEKDLRDLETALSLEADYVALSFVRRPADVMELRERVGDRALLVAKIEKGQALKHLGEILRVSDGVMVARGDLGVELDFEEVPIVQKRILRLTQEMAKLGITATQMLESMTRSPRPTRAEVSDVANALLDGTDAVMLSAETAVGEYPVESVAAMDRVIRRIERERTVGHESTDPIRPRGVAQVHHTVAGAVAGAAAEATMRLDSPFLVTFTRSGFTAWVVSAQRLRVPILAVTDQPRTWHRLALAWGVVPLLVEGDASYEELLRGARSFALDSGLGHPGDTFVVTAGVPFHVPGTTNLMRIETL